MPAKEHMANTTTVVYNPQKNYYVQLKLNCNIQFRQLNQLQYVHTTISRLYKCCTHTKPIRPSIDTSVSIYSALQKNQAVKMFA